MKKLIQFLFLALIMAVSGMSVTAQNTGDRQAKREQFATKQAQYIAQKLALDEATTQKFVDAYSQFQKELWALGSPKGLSAKQSLDYSQKILDLRKKYYDIYAQFLTEDQLNQEYRLERRMMNRMGNHHGDRNKGPKGTKGPKGKRGPKVKVPADNPDKK